MVQLLVVLSLVACCLSTFSEASRCDDNVINKIREEFWNNCNCVPRDIKRTATFLTPELEKYTTEDYYQDADQITCLYNQMDGENIILYTQYENSTSTTETSVMNLTEEDGVLVDEENGIYRYFLYVNKFGVSAFYKCSLTGEVGAPAGLIQASARSYDTEALAQAVEDLTYLGMDVRDTAYGDSCVQ